MKKMVIVDGVQYELVNINSTNVSNTQASTTNQCNTNHKEDNSGFSMICILGIVFLILYGVWKMCEYDSVNLP